MQIITGIGVVILTIIASIIGAIIGAIFGLFVGPAQMFSMFNSNPDSNESQGNDSI